MCIDWTALADADPGGEPWLYYDLETGVALIPLLSQMPYRTPPLVNLLTASRLADKYFRFPGSSFCSTRTPENESNVVVVEEPKHVLANSSDAHFSSAPPFASSSCTIDPQVQLSSLAPPVTVIAATPSPGFHLSSSVVQTSSAMASQVDGSPSIVVPFLSPCPLGISSVAFTPLCSKLRVPFCCVLSPL